MIGAVVLAAGAATRFGAPKQQLLLAEVLARLSAAPVNEIVVVAGAHDLSTEAVLVACPEWERGPGASLRCGLGALSPAAEAAVVVLADGPDLAPESVARVIEAWRVGDSDLVAASYDGIRGHPLLLARAAWADVPDEGLRDRDPQLVPCDDLGTPGDVDVPADLPERLR
jgi:CTP:molybdopterin cytidylyltransferase MocA